VLDDFHATRAMDDAGQNPQPLDALEQHWFAPLLEALRQGRIGMLSVHVPDAGESWETTRADLRRFWRRPRPFVPRT
jgi:hypothetical protein